MFCFILNHYFRNFFLTFLFELLTLIQVFCDYDLLPKWELGQKNVWFFSRYYGINDPVAEKLMRRASAMPKLEPPEDKSITTLYVGNLGDKLTEKELR